MNLRMPPGHRCPEVIKQMVRSIGETDTIAVINALGGRRVLIPSTEKAQVFQELAAIVGEEKTRLLCKELGRVVIYIPKLAGIKRDGRNAEIRRRFDELTKELSANKAVDLLVAAFGLSNRTIEEIVNS